MSSNIIFYNSEMSMIDRVSIQESCFFNGEPFGSSSFKNLHGFCIFFIPESDKDRYIILFDIYFLIFG
jgi:hypothetical protein